MNTNHFTILLHPFSALNEALAVRNAFFFVCLSLQVKEECMHRQVHYTIHVIEIQSTAYSEIFAWAVGEGEISRAFEI